VPPDGVEDGLVDGLAALFGLVPGDLDACVPVDVQAAAQSKNPASRAVARDAPLITVVRSLWQICAGLDALSEKSGR
jgi:hypothetical protein